MKNAVLITGDFRGMEWCAHSYEFLLRGSDVYVSLWDSSSTVHPLDASLSYHSGKITAERIRSILANHNVVNVVLEPFNESTGWKEHSYVYNTPLCHRWREGINAIKNSGKKYDMIAVIRPDLFFNTPENYSMPWPELQPDMLYSAWFLPSLPRLIDIFCLGTPEIIDKALVTKEEWIEANRSEGDWHNAYWTMVNDKGIKVTNTAFLPEVIISRPNYPNDILTWHDACISSNEWRNKYIEHQRLLYGMGCIRKNWGEELVNSLYPDK